MSHPDCAPRHAVDQIEISSPCTVSWDEMRQTRGEERIRFCGQCRQNVYNVEAMSRGEARRLIAAREGRVCVRILRRPDGTAVTADCWARLRAARRRGLLPFLGMMVLVGFTELMAMAVGLARLRGLPGALPSRPRVTLPVLGAPVSPSVPTVAFPGPSPAQPPSREPGYKLGGRAAPPPSAKHHYLMGKPAMPPQVAEPQVLTGDIIIGE